MKIYVGNLNFRTSESDLKKLFETHGAVSDSKIIIDKINGRSKGFGFITMDDNSEAQKAINELNGYSLESRKITVNEARPTNY